MARAASPMGRLPAGLRGRFLRARVLSQDVLQDVTGSIVRNGWPTSVRGRSLAIMHRWAAHGMVITVFLHMCRVFYTGAYRAPRQFNWVVGVILLILTFLLSFTGYLLPWDQLAIWAITVGTNMIGSTPFLGDVIHFLLVGDNTVAQNALLRFYTLHVIGLPLIAATFMAVHFWRIRKDGFSRGLTFTTRI